jgi:2-dehydro-3-deoxyphosphogluconate aldolase / (4S)-4-hydroxy-2-oxoglutarate aldolase
MDVARFEARPLMGILRGITPHQIEPLAEAVVAAGLETIEITMNTAGAPALIRHLLDVAAGRLQVGAGTVMTLDQLEAATGAGASFIVMPTLIPEVVSACVARSIPVFPGALTPQEIFMAWQAGATMVKVFPSNLFGPSYFKDLRGPFDDIKLLACGGVRAGNVAEFFSAGANGASFGGSIFEKGLETGDFEDIRQSVGRLVSALPR